MPSNPSDILLPLNYKNFGIIDSKYKFNANYDIVWSFEYSILNGIQYGICTFLTTLSSISAFPGHYLGVLGPSYSSNNIALSIAFDSTGYFALSNQYASGVSLSSINHKSLIIRDKDNVIFNEPLSSLDESFTISESKILRFIVCNSGRKLYIDYKISDKYKNLLTLSLSTYSWITDNTILYPGVSLCSPISALYILNSTFHLKNFHTQGNTALPSYENMKFIPLTSTRPNIYTTISGVTAIPI
jgi:hypothetical protein